MAASKKAAEAAKPVAKSAVSLTGAALVKIGDLSQKTGKKLRKEQ